VSSEIQALLKALGEQTLAINEQTAAINRLVQTTTALIEAVAAQDDVEDDSGFNLPTYLDGSPVSRGE
jgi:hypothetical protein